jgi:phosphatidylserine synthase
MSIDQPSIVSWCTDQSSWRLCLLCVALIKLSMVLEDQESNFEAGISDVDSHFIGLPQLIDIASSLSLVLYYLKKGKPIFVVVVSSSTASFVAPYGPGPISCTLLPHPTKERRIK